MNRMLAIAFVLTGSAALAQCALLTERCLCYADATSWIAKVHATSPNEGTVEVVFAAADAGVDAGVPDGGATVMFNAIPAAATGDFVLVNSFGSGFVLVNSGATMRCNNVELPADEYAKSTLDQSCFAKLQTAGLKQPPCHDTGCGCSGGSGLLPGLIVALMALFLGSRRH